MFCRNGRPGASTDLEGLAAFDTNHDGKLTDQDDQWSKLLLWQDKPRQKEAANEPLYFFASRTGATC